MSWLTVYQMVELSAGLRSPEDLRPSPLNPRLDASQLALNGSVEGVRRIQHDNLENVPFFLAAGFFFVLAQPPLAVAQWCFYGYAITRLHHFVAYLSAQLHDVRAAPWTPGSLIINGMSLWSLGAAMARL